MIIAKPKTNTFFALGMFLLLVYAASIYLLYDLLSSQTFSLWLVILLSLLLVISLIVTFKFVNSYQTIVLEKNRVEVRLIFGLSRYRLYFKDLQNWKEEQVKTSGQLFKQLEADFNGRRKLRISNQENDQYEKVVAHFRRYHGKKRQSE
jgi:ABC-type transport system involved in multi-copper enzyme maturation permease subunit